jgi:hypothetical protein
MERQARSAGSVSKMLNQTSILSGVVVDNIDPLGSLIE